MRFQVATTFRMKRLLFTAGCLCTLIAAGCAPTTEGTAAVGEAPLTFEADARPIIQKSDSVLSRDPKLISEPSGALYALVVHGEGQADQLGVWMSHDGGDTFHGPVAVSEKGSSVTSHGENSPSFVYQNGDAVVLWEQRSEGGTDLMFATALNWKWKFSAPQKVTSKTDQSINGFSALGAGRSGDVYAVWLDGRDEDNPPGTFSLYIRRVYSKRDGPGSEVRIAGGVCPCCRPAVAVSDDGKVFVAWRHVFEGSVRDIVVARSEDRASFGEPVRVAVDGWVVQGCPHSGPAILANGEDLWISWYSAPEGGQEGLRVAVSRDAGSSFEPSRIVSGEVRTANHPAFSVLDGQHVLVVFQGRGPDRDGNWSHQQPFVVDLSGEGVPLAIGSSNSVKYPALSSAPGGQLFSAWTEAREPGAVAVLSRGRS
ncbi:MAG TPA: hypothetical protein VMS12_06350 [Thermoanaerobaculia bacterium]|nr:hypothetical protein [Thermoanaerobaculia bacterium]